MEIVPVSTAGLPALVPVQGGAQARFARTMPEIEAAGATSAASATQAAIGPSRSAARSPRFQFSESARDVLQMERWHADWAQARQSFVTEAYTALHRKRAGTLFDMAA